MKMLQRFTSLASLVLAISPLAMADDEELGLVNYRSGAYLSGTVGHTFEYEIIGNELIASSDETASDLDEDMAYTGAIGLYVGQARTELEIGFRESGFQKFKPESLGFDLDGDLEYFTIMGNIFYDIPTEVSNLDFYVGGGLGLAIVSGDAQFTPDITVVGPTVSATTGRFDSTMHTFTYQFMGGLSYRLLDNVTLTGGYRFRAFSEFNDDNSLLVFREHIVHAAEVGLRIDF